VAPLKNKSQLAELVADYQQQAEHQVESKLHQTLAAAAAVAAVWLAELVAGVAEQPFHYHHQVVVAWNFVG